MVKVNYNGSFIELEDELEKGAIELDLLQTEDEENTIELDKVVQEVTRTLENTIEIEAVESNYE